MIINYLNKALRIRPWKSLSSATFTKMQEATKEYFVLGMGNPLLDISSEVTEETLTQYNLKTGAAVLMDDKQMPVFDELVKMPSVEYIPGGSTLNTIRSSQVSNKRTPLQLQSGTRITPLTFYQRLDRARFYHELLRWQARFMRREHSFSLA